MTSLPGDPVETAARERNAVDIASHAIWLDRYEGHPHRRDTVAPILQAVSDAEAALTALHAAGWRIVRTSTCECRMPDVLHDGSLSYPTEEQIVEEWLPESDRSDRLEALLDAVLTESGTCPGDPDPEVTDG